MLHSYSLEQLAASLGHYCTVALTEKAAVASAPEGYLYTVDPVSGVVVLYASGKAFVIMAHAIESLQIDAEKSMNVSEMDIHLQSENVKTYAQDTPHYLAQRREALIAHLKEQQFELESASDDPVIWILQGARVEPPYVATSVYSDHPDVLEKVRAVVMELSR